VRSIVSERKSDEENIINKTEKLAVKYTTLDNYKLPDM
jgi:hypothetical protein